MMNGTRYSSCGQIGGFSLKFYLLEVLFSDPGLPAVHFYTHCETVRPTAAAGSAAAAPGHAGIRNRGHRPQDNGPSRPKGYLMDIDSSNPRPITNNQCQSDLIQPSKPHYFRMCGGEGMRSPLLHTILPIRSGLKATQIPCQPTPSHSTRSSCRF
jgi:hypothetical protein